MSILDDIKAYKLEEVARAKEAHGVGEIEAAARLASPPRGFAEALRRASAGGGYGLIAEVKKASPSKGLIRADFDPEAIAKAYESAGAACLSVLTDGPSFQGAPEYLVAARAAVALPVLRKDFMVDPWQVAEARAMGADCVLLLMALVDDGTALAIEDAALSWGMDVLIEVHSAEELERAKTLRSPLVGINNRDLRTFEVSLDVTRKLAREVPPDRLIVSESGLATRQDLAQIARYGVRCFLIGETLMRAENVELATREILRGPWTPEAG